MSDLTPVVPDAPTRISAAQYFALVESGVLAEDDRVELLEGVIVAVPPQNPPHASSVMELSHPLLRASGVYRDLRRLHAGEAIDLAALPGVSIEVVELLPLSR